MLGTSKYTYDANKVDAAVDFLMQRITEKRNPYTTTLTRNDLLSVIINCMSRLVTTNNLCIQTLGFLVIKTDETHINIFVDPNYCQPAEYRQW